MKTAYILLAFAVAAVASPAPKSDSFFDDDSLFDDNDGGGVPFRFTSRFSIKATPQQVVDANGVATGGLPGAKGWFKFGLNSKENVICYNITLQGFLGTYQSPALTATHIHQGVKGKPGPPR
jgi:hypothetical protein